MLFRLDTELLERKRKEQNLPKYVVSTKIAGSQRQGFYFDLLRSGGWTRKIEYVTNLVRWAGNGVVLQSGKKRKKAVV